MKLFCDCWGCIPDLREIKSVMRERTNTFMFKENTKLATYLLTFFIYLRNSLDSVFKFVFSIWLGRQFEDSIRNNKVC